ncbi:MAG: DnaJ domain-containing protein [Acidobacteria bacterium]|nr:DnaJ domain-containing protein [Acidobacteriota bacterium]
MNLALIEDPYKTLGVKRGATEAEIKQAYFALVRKHPPEHDPEGFKRIRAAYEKLRAGDERAETDLFLIDEQAGTFNLTELQRFNAEPPPITPEMIRADLIALEAALLLEEALAAR